jgi:putative DNA primase/helicase
VTDDDDRLHAFQNMREGARQTGAAPMPEDVAPAPPLVKVLAEEEYTDRGHARRLHALHAERLAWVPQWGCWALHDGIRWKHPADVDAFHLMQAVGDEMLEVRKFVPDDKTGSLLKEVLRLQKARSVKDALEFARSLFAVDADAFDAQPHLLNCLNGTLDLDQMVLRPHDATDRITKVTNAAYLTNAVDKTWTKAIKHAIPDDQVQTYVKRLLGTTLHGGHRLDRIVLFYGPPRTGKGTIQQAAATALGDYAQTMGIDDLVEGKNRGGGGPRPELVTLRGARMVNIYEMPPKKLDSVLVKSMAGSDPITARGLHQMPITFVPEFTPWWSANFRPGLPSEDDAIWERIREVPIANEIAKDKRDPSIRAELTDPENREAMAAILAWMVTGWCDYKKSYDLKEPEAVTRSTDDYRDSMDHLQDWAAERLIFRADQTARPQEISRSTAIWFKDAHLRRPPMDAIKRHLERRGCTLKRKDKNSPRKWEGVSVLPDGGAPGTGSK